MVEFVPVWGASEEGNNIEVKGRKRQSYLTSISEIDQ